MSHQIAVLKAEVHRLTTALRTNQRWASDSRFKKEVLLEHETPLLRSLKTLYNALQLVDDLQELDTVAYCTPFIDVITSEETSGIITGIALSAVNKFLVYDFISYDAPRAREAVNDIAYACTRCKFEPVSIADDEAVLSKLLEVIGNTLRCSAGPYLTDDSVWSLAQCAFLVSRIEKSSYLLSRSAESVLHGLVMSVYGRAAEFAQQVQQQQLPVQPLSSTSSAVINSSTRVGAPYGPEALRRLLSWLAGLTDPKQHGRSTRVLGLELINITLETGGSALASLPGVVTVVQAEVCKHLIANSRSPDLPVLALALRVVYNLFSSMTHVLKVQLEVFMTSVHLYLADSRSSAPEQRELALESLVEFTRDSERMVELWANYDCDPACTNLYEYTVRCLCRNAVPEPGKSLNSLHGIALEGVLAILWSMARRCPGHPSYKAAAPHRAEAEGGGDTTAVDVDQQELDVSLPRGLGIREGQGFPGLLDMGAGAQGQGGHVGVDSGATAALLRQRRQLKKRMALAAEKFRSDPKGWVSYAQELGLLPSPVATPSDAALFLRTCPGIDRTALGLYISEPDDAKHAWNTAVRKAYVSGFDFRGMRVDNGLRVFLESFRLPGEAQKIERLMQAFSERLYEQSPGPLSHPDTAFVLSYSIIMLNTDLHNKQVRKKMSKLEFTRNNRGIDQGKDLPQEYLSAIYDSIASKEIHMRADVSMFGAAAPSSEAAGRPASSDAAGAQGRAGGPGGSIAGNVAADAGGSRGGSHSAGDSAGQSTSSLGGAGAVAGGVGTVGGGAGVGGGAAAGSGTAHGPHGSTAPSSGNATPLEGEGDAEAALQNLGTQWDGILSRQAAVTAYTRVRGGGAYAPGASMVGGQGGAGVLAGRSGQGGAAGLTTPATLRTKTSLARMVPPFSPVPTLPSLAAYPPQPTASAAQAHAPASPSPSPPGFTRANSSTITPVRPSAVAAATGGAESPLRMDALQLDAPPTAPSDGVEGGRPHPLPAPGTVEHDAASSSDPERDMFALVAEPALHALATVFSTTQDPAVLRRAAAGFRDYVLLSAHYGLDSAMNGLAYVLSTSVCGDMDGLGELVEVEREVLAAQAEAAGYLDPEDTAPAPLAAADPSAHPSATGSASAPPTTTEGGGGLLSYARSLTTAYIRHVRPRDFTPAESPLPDASAPADATSGGPVLESSAQESRPRPRAGTAESAGSKPGRAGGAQHTHGAFMEAPTPYVHSAREIADVVTHGSASHPAHARDSTAVPDAWEDSTGQPTSRGRAGTAVSAGSVHTLSLPTSPAAFVLRRLTLALKVLLGLAAHHGDALRESWAHVIAVLVRLAVNDALPCDVPGLSPEDLRAPNGQRLPSLASPWADGMDEAAVGIGSGLAPGPGPGGRGGGGATTGRVVHVRLLSPHTAEAGLRAGGEGEAEEGESTGAAGSAFEREGGPSESAQEEGQEARPDPVSRLPHILSGSRYLRALIKEHDETVAGIRTRGGGGGSSRVPPPGLPSTAPASGSHQVPGQGQRPGRGGGGGGGRVSGHWGRSRAPARGAGAGASGRSGGARGGGGLWGTLTSLFGAGPGEVEGQDTDMDELGEAVLTAVAAEVARSETIPTLLSSFSSLSTASLHHLTHALVSARTPSQVHAALHPLGAAALTEATGGDSKEGDSSLPHSSDDTSDIIAIAFLYELTCTVAVRNMQRAEIGLHALHALSEVLHSACSGAAAAHAEFLEQLALEQSQSRRRKSGKRMSSSSSMSSAVQDVTWLVSTSGGGVGAGGEEAEGDEDAGAAQRYRAALYMAERVAVAWFRVAITAVTLEEGGLCLSTFVPTPTPAPGPATQPTGGQEDAIAVRLDQFLAGELRSAAPTSMTGGEGGGLMLGGRRISCALDLVTACMHSCIAHVPPRMLLSVSPRIASGLSVLFQLAPSPSLAVPLPGLQGGLGQGGAQGQGQKGPDTHSGSLRAFYETGCMLLEQCQASLWSGPGVWECLCTLVSTLTSAPPPAAAESSLAHAHLHKRLLTLLLPYCHCSMSDSACIGLAAAVLSADAWDGGTHMEQGGGKGVVDQGAGGPAGYLSRGLPGRRRLGRAATDASDKSMPGRGGTSPLTGGGQGGDREKGASQGGAGRRAPEYVQALLAGVQQEPVAELRQFAAIASLRLLSSLCSPTSSPRPVLQGLACALVHLGRPSQGPAGTAQAWERVYGQAEGAHGSAWALMPLPPPALPLQHGSGRLSPVQARVAYLHASRGSITTARAVLSTLTQVVLSMATPAFATGDSSPASLLSWSYTTLLHPALTWSMDMALGPLAAVLPSRQEVAPTPALLQEWMQGGMPGHGLGAAASTGASSDSLHAPGGKASAGTGTGGSSGRTAGTGMMSILDAFRTVLDSELELSRGEQGIEGVGGSDQQEGCLPTPPDRALSMACAELVGELQGAVTRLLVHWAGTLADLPPSTAAPEGECRSFLSLWLHALLELSYHAALMECVSPTTAQGRAVADRLGLPPAVLPTLLAHSTSGEAQASRGLLSDTSLNSLTRLLLCVTPAVPALARGTGQDPWQLVREVVLSARHVPQGLAAHLQALVAVQGAAAPPTAPAPAPVPVSVTEASAEQGGAQEREGGAAVHAPAVPAAQQARAPSPVPPHTALPPAQQQAAPAEPAPPLPAPAAAPAAAATVAATRAPSPVPFSTLSPIRAPVEQGQQAEREEPVVGLGVGIDGSFIHLTPTPTPTPTKQQHSSGGAVGHRGPYRGIEEEVSRAYVAPPTPLRPGPSSSLPVPVPPPGGSRGGGSHGGGHPVPHAASAMVPPSQQAGRGGGGLWGYFFSTLVAADEEDGEGGQGQGQAQGEAEVVVHDEAEESDTDSWASEAEDGHGHGEGVEETEEDGNEDAEEAAAGLAPLPLPPPSPAPSSASQAEAEAGGLDMSARSQQAGDSNSVASTPDHRKGKRTV